MPSWFDSSPSCPEIAFSRLSSYHLYKMQYLLFCRYTTQFLILDFFFHALVPKSVLFSGTFCDKEHIFCLYFEIGEPQDTYSNYLSTRHEASSGKELNLKFSIILIVLNANIFKWKRILYQTL